MDKRFLRYVLEETVKRFDYMNNGPGHDESFKFTAIATFQREWDLEAEDFLDMFQRATLAAIPLLDVQKNLPNAGLIKLMEMGADQVDGVRTAFRTLFSDDGGDIHLRQGRLQDFVEKINAMEQATSLKGNLYKINLYTALAYLNLYHPEDNFLVKVSEARTWCLALGYSPDIGTGVKFSLERYYEMCHRCLQEVRECTELIEMNKSRAKAKGCTDATVAEHILMYDLIHSASSYIFVDQMGLDISKIDRLKASKEEYMLLKQHNDRQHKLEELAQRELLDQQLLVGKAVASKRFGPGTIQSLEGETLAVAFADQVKYFDLKTCLKINLLGLEEDCFAAYKRDLELREEKSTLAKKLAEEEA